MYIPALSKFSVILLEERFKNVVKGCRSCITMESGETPQACKMLLYEIHQSNKENSLGVNFNFASLNI